jgi:hypothetical protein
VDRYRTRERTDPHGGFSTRRKVKRSHEYRAGIEETPACAYQLSNIETVKAERSGKSE